MDNPLLRTLSTLSTPVWGQSTRCVSFSSTPPIHLPHPRAALATPDFIPPETSPAQGVHTAPFRPRMHARATHLLVCALGRHRLASALGRHRLAPALGRSPLMPALCTGQLQPRDTNLRSSLARRRCLRAAGGIARRVLRTATDKVSPQTLLAPRLHLSRADRLPLVDHPERDVLRAPCRVSFSAPRPTNECTWSVPDSRYAINHGHTRPLRASRRSYPPFSSRRRTRRLEWRAPRLMSRAAPFLRAGVSADTQ